MSSKIDIQMEELIRRNGIRPKFVVRVLPHDFPFVSLRMPDGFVDEYGEKVREKVKLYFPNGDWFECMYWHKEKSIVGLEKIGERYNILSFSFLVAKYISPSEFYILLIGTASVENIYPIDTIHCHLNVNKEVSLSDSLLRGKNTGYSMSDRVNATLVDYNANATDIPSIEFLFSGGVVEVIDCSLDKCWKVGVKKEGGVISFVDGWSHFVSAVGTGVGDFIVLTRSGNPFHLQVAIFTESEYKPCHFLRLVNKSLLCRGELAIPRIFWDKYVKDIGTKITLESSTGLQHWCTYVLSGHKLVGLHRFVLDNGVK